MHRGEPVRLRPAAPRAARPAAAPRRRAAPEAFSSAALAAGSRSTAVMVTTTIRGSRFTAARITSTPPPPTSTASGQPAARSSASWPVNRAPPARPRRASPRSARLSARTSPDPAPPRPPPRPAGAHSDMAHRPGPGAHVPHHRAGPRRQPGQHQGLGTSGESTCAPRWHERVLRQRPGPGRPGPAAGQTPGRRAGGRSSSRHSTTFGSPPDVPVRRPRPGSATRPTPPARRAAARPPGCVLLGPALPSPSNSAASSPGPGRRAGSAPRPRGARGRRWPRARSVETGRPVQSGSGTARTPLFASCERSAPSGAGSRATTSASSSRPRPSSGRRRWPPRRPAGRVRTPDAPVRAAPPYDAEEAPGRPRRPPRRGPSVQGQMG